jgi:protein-S-isoprenylcysteine O-methyltransferase Ste14
MEAPQPAEVRRGLHANGLHRARVIQAVDLLQIASAEGRPSVRPSAVYFSARRELLRYVLNRRAGPPGVREDRRNRWVIVAFTVLGLLDGYLPAYTDRIGVWIIDGEATRWLGVVLFGLGGALRLWPVHVLGDRFSGLVAIQAEHRLVTGGIYGVIRHPSYLGLLLSSLGWALAFRSGVGVLLTVLIALPLFARIQSEEALLQAHFGGEYEEYCARTRRLLPGIY